jgi:hypothetical protein
MTDYRATPEQWEVQEKFAPESEDACCLLELRSRIERLELGAGIRDVVAKEVRQSYPEKPSKSLAQRVAGEIALAEGGWHNEARAAIREVATWLRDNAEDTRTTTAIWMLEKELDE